MIEQHNDPVDRTLDGIKLAVDRQLYPSASTKLTEGQKRVPRGGMVTLSLSQVEALLSMAEGAWQIGYDKGFIAGCEHKL